MNGPKLVTAEMDTFSTCSSLVLFYRNLMNILEVVFIGIHSNLTILHFLLKK